MVEVMTIYKITLCLVLIVVVDFAVDCESFTDIPPQDYNERTGLDDCADRFYTNTSFAPVSGVFNGDPVEPGEYSAFAAIGWTRSSTKIDYLCGGTLITLNYVLTAAHCSVDSKQQKPDTVRLGDVDLSSDENEEYVQQIAIKRFIRHPDHKGSRSYHDIALIELEGAIKPGNFVCSACLWTEMQLNFDRLTVIGFGATQYGADQSPVLLKADLPPLAEAECKDRFPMSRKIAEGIMDSQFCAASPDKDACPGDSGGPILVHLVDPAGSQQKMVPFITGVISIGTGCNEGSLGLYTRVASYLDWIQNVTEVSFDPKDCARNTECKPFYKDVVSAVQRPLFSPEFRVDLMIDDSDDAICGGSLIDYRHVITSADCVSGQIKPTFVLLRGDRANITEITIHPESHKPENNVAILGLDRYYDPGAKYKSTGPACLLKKSMITKDKLLVSAIEPQNRYRLAVNASIVPAAMCPDGLICTENKENLIPKACEVQAGGSLASYGRNDEDIDVPYLHGINSKGSSCGGSGLLLEAVSTAEHYGWIESVVLRHIADILTKDESFIQNEYFQDDPCLPASGEGLGRCVPAEHCERLLNEHRKGLVQVKTCLFEGDVPIVCCPNAYL